MPGHEPGKVAELIEKQAEFSAEARELLEHVGTIQRAVYYDIGVNKALVVLPGYGPLSDPAGYLHVADKLHQ